MKNLTIPFLDSLACTAPFTVEIVTDDRPDQVLATEDAAPNAIVFDALYDPTVLSTPVTQAANTDMSRGKKMQITVIVSTSEAVCLTCR